MLSYADVRERIGSGTAHILVGNGFSIACDPVFRYASLFEAAVEAGLSDRAVQLFDRLGTNNFEGALRLLESAAWAAGLYGAPSEAIRGMAEDSEVIKRTLVEAVTSSHLAHVGCIPEERYAAAREFLEPYHNIFTTNYDLLLYWTVLQSGRPSHQDGFRPDEDDPETPYVIFSERLGNTKGLLYLHGALHLYVAAGELRKHSWRRTGQRLTELIRAGLNVGEYPLFVAEGTPEKKLEQIQRNGYLWYALDKLARIASPLVVFGHSFSEGDQHIADTLADSSDLPALYVGLHGDPNSARNLQIMSVVDGIGRRREERERQRAESRRGRHRSRGSRSAFVLELFDSSSARPWG